MKKSKVAKKSLTEKLDARAAADKFLNKVEHIIVEARAGTGKTTTLVEGLKVMRGMKPSIQPSLQQQAVWNAMGGNHRDVAFVAFNRSIADELKQRVPTGCNAMTMHSMGYRAVRNAFNVKGSPDGWRVQNIISEIYEKDIRELRRSKSEVINAVEKLVALCKQNLVGYSADFSFGHSMDWKEELSNLASHYDIDLNGNADEVFSLVPRVLERCMDVNKDNKIDFNDMVWLPVVCNLALTKYDMLLVDEAQDLNRCQQQLILKAVRSSGQLLFCGDPKQAIYGFAGADVDSMPRMSQTLAETDHGVVELPLTMTYRCGKAIVAEANKIVAEFHAHESNGEGLVEHDVLLGQSTEGPSDYAFKNIDSEMVCTVQPSDMILCRVNAPLVTQCFRFLRAGIKANIQGRDVGQGLISTVNKLKAANICDFEEKLSDWYHNECKKENAKRNPTESRLINLEDRYNCLQCFAEGKSTVAEIIVSIGNIFSDKDSAGIRLSSVHKAKGLEADTVYIILPENGGMPHPMAKSKWQIEQEMNLKYVAITRAKKRLVWVS